MFNVVLTIDMKNDATFDVRYPLMISPSPFFLENKAGPAISNIQPSGRCLTEKYDDEMKESGEDISDIVDYPFYFYPFTPKNE